MGLDILEVRQTPSPQRPMSSVPCFVCHPWLVWNQSLGISPRLITKDQSTRWMGSSVRLHMHTLVGTPSRACSAEDLLSRGYVRCQALGSISSAFGTSSQPGARETHPDHVDAFEGSSDIRYQVHILQQKNCGGRVWIRQNTEEPEEQNIIVHATHDKKCGSNKLI